MAPAGVSSNVFLKGLQRKELSFCAGAASFLQSDFWGAFKVRFGWEALAFGTEWADGGKSPLLVLRRKLAAGFSLAYIPWGPELPPVFFSGGAGPAGEQNPPSSVPKFPLCYDALKELAVALRKILPRDTVFIRFDPPWQSEGADVFPPALPPPFVRSGADIQPPDTVLVDLSPPGESILERMKPKWRYNGRLALKKGVTVRRAGGEEIGIFYDLLKETARRDGIAVHGIEYYRALFADVSPNEEKSGAASGGSPGKVPDIRLYLAEHEGDVLAGIVTLFRGKEAVYLYGASSNRKRNLMAPYALQIKAMEDAKASGCSEYDLFGIPPNDDPSQPMAGLYRFKTGFGGGIIHRPGSWDYPCRSLIYRLFRAAETLRKNFRTLKKRRAAR